MLTSKKEIKIGGGTFYIMKIIIENGKIINFKEIMDYLDTNPSKDSLNTLYADLFEASTLLNNSETLLRNKLLKQIKKALNDKKDDELSNTNVVLLERPAGYIDDSAISNSNGKIFAITLLMINVVIVGILFGLLIFMKFIK